LFQEKNLHIQKQFLKGMLYFPPESFQKPLNYLDLVIMAHDSFQEDCDVKIDEEIKKSFFFLIFNY